MIKLTLLATACLSAFALAGCGGGGGGGGGTPLPTVSSSPPVVTGTTVVWAGDNRTRTTTTTYSDGTSASSTVDVAPIQSGATLSLSGGVNSTSPLINTYGNGVIQTLEDGSLARPFTQSTLVNSGIADPNASIATSTQALDLRWGTKATPYTLPTTDNVRARYVSTIKDTQLFGASGTIYPVYRQSNAFDSTIPLDQSTSLMQGTWITSDVKAAWAQGWTGQGVRIGVIDDFTANSFGEYLRTPLQTGCGVNSLFGVNVTLCSSRAEASFRLTHGEQVALIAGGSKTTIVGAITETGGFAAPGDSGLYNSAMDLTITLSSPLYGVAKDAEVLRNDFLSYQSSTGGLFSELQRWGVGTDAASQTFRTLKVVNLSLGGTSQNPVSNGQTYTAQLALANASTVHDAVFVKAAGNGSCVISQTNCDPLNAVFYFSTPYSDKSLIVGALNQAEGSIASYSNVAGTFADRFVVADGRGIQQVDGSYQEGTSFAAPRVSGYAAILRQKFPNLTAPKVTSIILDTATWNPSWGPRDSANQAVYGQGEASLTRALAPVGRLR